MPSWARIRSDLSKGQTEIVSRVRSQRRPEGASKEKASFPREEGGEGGREKSVGLLTSSSLH